MGEYMCAWCEQPIGETEIFARVGLDDAGYEIRAHSDTDGPTPSHAIKAIWQKYEQPHDPERTVALTQREAEPVLHLINAIEHGETVGPNSITYFQLRDPVLREALWQKIIKVLR